jgi:hypothetical protein
VAHNLNVVIGGFMPCFKAASDPIAARGALIFCGM